MQRSRGFTLVELLVTITVIAIISGIAIMSFSVVQRDQRNSVRETKAQIIANALEKYYRKNGEYPSVPSLTQADGSSVASLLRLQDPTVLVFPKSSDTVTNSLTPDTAATTKIAYNGAGNSDDQDIACRTQTDGACDSFSLQYYDEADDMIKTIDSLHADRNVKDTNTLPVPSTPALSSDMVAGKVHYVVSGSTCDTGGLQYKIRYATSSTLPDWTTIQWQDVETLDVDPGSNTLFYAQAMTRCNNGDDVSLPSDESNIDKFNLLETRTKATLSGSTISVSASLASPCATGSTAKFLISQRIDTSAGIGSWTTLSNWSTTASVSVATTTPAKTYNFKAQSRCDTATTTGTASPESDIVSVVTTPPSPSVSISTNSTTSTWTWSAATCPVNYTPRYNLQWTANGNIGNGAWSETTATSSSRTTTSQGYTFGAHVQARCFNAAQTPTTSNWSATSNTPTYTRPVSNTVSSPVGGIRLYNYGTGIAMSGEWRLHGASSNCGPAYLIKQVSWRYSINDTGDSDSSDARWTAFTGYSDWETTYIGGKIGKDVDKWNKIEFSFHLRCINKYTNVAGASNYSDRFGNIWVVQNSGPGKWQTVCVGHAANDSGYCAEKTNRNAALDGSGAGVYAGEWSYVQSIRGTPYGW